MLNVVMLSVMAPCPSTLTFTSTMKKTQSVVIVSIAFYWLLCWTLLCWVSL